MELDNLIFDRTQADVDRAKYLAGLWQNGTFTGTTAELAEWATDLKGAYNATDLNRVIAAMDYLNEYFLGLGYDVGYTKIAVPHQPGGGGGILPSGYTQLEYIQSTGTQYIDTGIVAKTGHTANIGFNRTDTPNDLESWIFAVWEGSTGYRAGYMGVPIATDSGFTYEQGPTGDAYMVAKGTCDQDYTISSYLFSQHEVNGAVHTENSKYRLYYCKLFNEVGTILRDFVPCKNPNGEVGLYDIVDQTFFANAGTGTFIAGPPTNINLPDGYTQLEYIQSSGTQYIDTGIVAKTGHTANIGFNRTDTPNDLESWIFAVWEGSTGYRAGYMGVPIATDSGFTYEQGPTGDAYMVAKGTCDQDYTISSYLFSQHEVNGAAHTKNSKYRLYYCKLFNEVGTILRDFVPCKNPSNSVGLYDIVNSKFYSNSGSGAFTAGPEIEIPEQDQYTWYETDIPTQNEMSIYIEDVSRLRDKIPLLADTPETPDDMQLLTYQEANDIEKILDNIERVLIAMENGFLLRQANTLFMIAGGVFNNA